MNDKLGTVIFIWSTIQIALSIIEIIYLFAWKDKNEDFYIGRVGAKAGKETVELYELVLIAAGILLLINTFLIGVIAYTTYTCSLSLKDARVVVHVMNIFFALFNFGAIWAIEEAVSYFKLDKFA